jgi:hypothetical protein
VLRLAAGKPEILSKKRGIHAAFFYFAPSLGLKEGQWEPVERNTSAEGRFRHLMPKIVQDRGKAGSQVILK